MFHKIKKIRPLVKLRIWKRRLLPRNEDPDIGSSEINLLRTFPTFKPHSGGSYVQRAQLTIQAINATLPSLDRIASMKSGILVDPLPIETFPNSPEEAASAEILGELFIYHGSDKASHDRSYHLLYGPILKRLAKPSVIVEIGLGTNNINVASNMGAGGKPGASLRAFHDFHPESKVYGGDIDTGILFNEPGIETFEIDQTDPASVERFISLLPSPCDLFIDDGLHSTHANLNSLYFGLMAVKPGGWVVIEDIGEPAVVLWKIVCRILPDCYTANLYYKGTSFVLAVQKRHLPSGRKVDD